MKYSDHFSTKKTPQTKAIPGKDMKPNNAGGYGFKPSPVSQLDRFLILGTEGGTYYVNEQKLTVDNAKHIAACIKMDGNAVLDRIYTISNEGRAVKNSPALFALAMCTSPKFAELDVRRKAFELLPKIARTSTHLFEFIEYMKNFRGWGRLAQTGVKNWYQDKDPNMLEYQMVKYRQRNGWTHNDVLRLAKPIPASPLHNQLYGFAKNNMITGEHDFKLITGYMKIQKVVTAKKAANIINDYKLPMEAVPTEFMTSPVVWDALLPHLPITATIRNLRNMAKCGFMVPFSYASRVVSNRISNSDIINKGRVHPVQFLNAILNYPVGAPRVAKADGVIVFGTAETKWLVDKDVVRALNAGFSKSFKTITPSGKHIMIALDVSASMNWKWCLGSNGMTPREASAALALITINTEPNHFIGVFAKSFEQFNKIKANMSVDDAVKAVSHLSFGSTNVSAPIEWADKNNFPVDAVVCYTDNETYWGKTHPCQALVKYRNKTGIDTKFISVSMCANNTTVADPSDPKMLDIVGFDTATPKAISEFISI